MITNLKLFFNGITIKEKKNILKLLRVILHPTTYVT